MLAEARQMIIVEEVRRRGSVRVSELTEQLGVSEMTIRRDLDALARSGLVEKVHGGATTVMRLTADEPGFEVNSHRQIPEKEAIALRAAELVKPGQAIALSGGTTTWRLARQIRRTPNLTVVTNSLPVADVLHAESRPDLTVVLTGGVRTPSDALVGPIAETTLHSLHLDLLFLGVHGMAEGAGFTTPNPLEAETDKALIASAASLVVVADHTKWGVRGLVTIAELSDAQVLVTDEGLSPDARMILGETIRELVIAPLRNRRRSVAQTPSSS
jgi:DeoR/GlpR family transcriptional regulator of sugar metabolism